MSIAVLKPLGGGEDPKDKPKGETTFKSQKEINDFNLWLRDFLLRKGAPMAALSVGGRDVGDVKPKFVYATNSLKPDRPKLQTTLPNGITIDQVYQTKEGLYGYNHPTEDYFVQVDPQAIYQKYGGKK